MTNRLRTACLILGASLCLLSLRAHGDPPRGHGHGPPHRPPPEAFAACKGKAADDACTVDLGDRSIDGTCRKPPKAKGDGELACVPDGPPPEAFDACDGKAAGDACTVDLGDRAIDGTCRRPPHGDGPLACVPDDMPPPPEE